MAYKIELTKKAHKQLKNIDKKQGLIIIKWLDKHVNNCTNYKEVASYKELTGNNKGAFRYRIGNYRVICELKNNELVIVAIRIGHRKDIYK